MSAYSKKQITEMAYQYLVEGKSQPAIEKKMNLKAGTISRELKPFGITGSKNNEGRGYGQTGNHCGIASYSEMGFKVSREQINYFLFGDHDYGSDAEFFDTLKEQYMLDSQSEDDSYMSYQYQNDGLGYDNENGIGAVINGYLGNIFSSANKGTGDKLNNKTILLIIAAILIFIFRKKILSFLFAIAPYLITIVLAVVIFKWLINSPSKKRGGKRGTRRKVGIQASERQFDSSGLIPAGILWVIALGGLKNGAADNIGSLLLFGAMMIGGFLCVFRKK